MRLEYLPKLLLQGDESPYVEHVDLIRAAEAQKLAYCVHPRGCAAHHKFWFIFLCGLTQPELIPAPPPLAGRTLLWG